MNNNLGFKSIKNETIAKVYSVNGMADAIMSLTMSKFDYTWEKALKIQQLVYDCCDSQGFIKENVDENKYTQLKEMWNKIVKWGISEHDHDTLVRYIDITFFTEKLHKAGQGDLDAHAMNVFNNKVIRSSTRLAFEKFKKFDKSPFYDNKIIHYGELEEMGLVKFPMEIYKNKERFVNTGYGYIHEDVDALNDNNYQEKHLKKDYMRGLLTLDSPNNAIWKCTFWGARYLFYRRDTHTTAHPELQLICRNIKDQLMDKMPLLGDVIDQRFIFDENIFVHMGEATWKRK